MAEHPAARRYARALFEAAQNPNEGTRQKVAEDLTRTGEVFSRPPVAQLYRHRLIPLAAKRALVDQTLPADPHPLVRNLVHLLVDKGREDILDDIVAAYTRLVEAAQGVADVEVRTAVDLGSDGYTTLQQKLSAILGRPVRLHPRVEPELLGGAILRVGDTLYDASVKRRLERLQRRLATGDGQRGGAAGRRAG